MCPLCCPHVWCPLPSPAVLCCVVQANLALWIQHLSDLTGHPKFKVTSSDRFTWAGQCCLQGRLAALL